ncbi:MAG: hypothetical protein P4M02_09665, partial [Clostridia bacterium]|nr:hypothetical protein [Clostridia bacterium]
TNAVLAVVLAAPLMLLSKPLLMLWMGRDFAQDAWPVLSVLAAGFALFAMNVTAHYALLAMGRVRLVTALKISHYVRRVVTQNIVLALTVKLAVLILGALGLANIWEAVLADTGVTLLAVLSSMRVLLRKNRFRSAKMS